MERVLITGASRGIGLELTKQFLKYGFKVIATYRGEPSSALQALLSHQDLTLMKLEVTHGQSITQLASALDDTPIDILINNAGVIGPDRQAMDDIEAEAWLNTFSVNTIAPLMLSRALIPHLKRSPNPRIITISSQMGSLNRTSTGMYAYRSSKAAVNKVMQVLATELRSMGIIVCPIHPGWVKTDMGGEDADISVEESAKGILTFVMGVTQAQSGQFYTWQGEQHDW